MAISITKGFPSQDYLIPIETKKEKNWTEGQAREKIIFTDIKGALK